MGNCSNALLSVSNSNTSLTKLSPFFLTMVSVGPRSLRFRTAAHTSPPIMHHNSTVYVSATQLR